jgi:hypothetical protein
MSSRDIANLKNGLVAAWIPSLGSTGYRLVDRVGSNHGVLTNMDAGTDWVVSNGNIALDFDGTDDFVDLGGSQIPLAGLQRISFSAWVYVTSLSNRIMPIGRYVNNTSLGANRRGDGFFTVNYTTPGQVYLGIQAATAGGTDYIEYYSTQTITANAWNHIAAAVFINGNSSSGNIWINGKLATTNIVYSGTPPTSYPSNVATGIYTINRFIPGSGTPVYLGGRVDDVRLYNRNLTSSEVQLLASKRGIGLQPRPKQFTYYQFPSGSKRRRLLTGMP